MEPIQRQTAYKIWISNLLEGKFIRTSGEWEPNYVEIGDSKISRVNIIAPIVDKFAKNDMSYLALTLDDGSAKIAIKAWKEEAQQLSDHQIGDLILVIAKVKDFDNRLYLIPETVKKLDNPLWAKLRRLELEKLHGEPKHTLIAQDEPRPQPAPKQENEDDAPLIIEEKVTNENAGDKRQRILDSIESLDTNNGADKEMVITHSGVGKDEALTILEDMLKEGEIFELHPGKYRTIL